jgi:hypothetical protein
LFVDSCRCGTGRSAYSTSSHPPVELIGWDTNLSFSSYESRSISSARAARVDDRSRKEFLDHAVRRLQSAEAKGLAASLCRDLAAADGTAPRESALVTEIRGVLGVG